MKICVDAGHGGHDSGAVSADGVEEKEVNLAYALELRNTLVQAGHDVVMTRVRDEYPSLTERAEIANSEEVDCFISLHANASRHPTAHGAWVIHDDDTVHGDELASHVFQEMAKIPGVADDDPEEEVFPDNSPWVGNRELTVLGKTKSPAILVELGFLTNVDDLTMLLDEDFRAAICRAIWRGTTAWGFDRGHLDPELPEPEVDLVDSVDDYQEPDFPERVEPLVKKSVRQVARTSSENSGWFSLRVLQDFVGSAIAKTVLGPVKLLILKAALAWIERALRDILDLPEEG